MVDVAVQMDPPPLWETEPWKAIVKQGFDEIEKTVEHAENEGMVQLIDALQNVSTENGLSELYIYTSFFHCIIP